MEKIDKIIDSLMGKMSGRRPQQSRDIQQRWQRVLGGRDAQHTQIIGWKDGRLSVAVDSPAWLYQMSLKKQKILEELRQDIPDIREIYFKIGKVDHGQS